MDPNRTSHLWFIFFSFSAWFIIFLYKYEIPPLREIETVIKRFNDKDITSDFRSFIYDNFTRDIPVVRTTNREPLRDQIQDCSTVRRYCMHDVDCETICKPYKLTIYKCDNNNVCYPAPIEDNEDPGKVVCDTKHGEYALLVGYTTIGTALWQCVQLYRHYVDSTKFCENGVFDMDANKREPSYCDCTCPAGTIRAVYSIASFYDNAIPHCIPRETWKFYKSDMVEK